PIAEPELPGLFPLIGRNTNDACRARRRPGVLRDFDFYRQAPAAEPCGIRTRAVLADQHADAEADRTLRETAHELRDARFRLQRAARGRADAETKVEMRRQHT